MRFEIGDEIEQQLVQTMTHEYYRCRVALESFTNYASQNSIQAQSNLLSIKSYNDYAMFVQHLYEFTIACMKRTFRNTDTIRFNKSDSIIIGKNLRTMRNSLSHVDYRRVRVGAEHNNRITLSEFVIQYHKFAILLYEWIGGLWSLNMNENLDDITNFNQEIFNSFHQS